MSVGDRDRAIFYLGLPTVVGFLLGANQTGIGQVLPWWASVVFWVTCTLVSWLVFHLGTLAASYILRPWEPSLIVKLGAGLLIASLPARLLINAYVGAFEAVMPEGRGVRELPTAQLTLDFVLRYAQVWSGPYVLWISTNMFFDRVVGFSRYRVRPQHETEAHGEHAADVVSVPVDAPTTQPVASPGSQTVSALLSRLPRSLGLNILAVKSEDHYLRVYTDRGDALILYRLSTATEELERLGYGGLQIHRSYWVRREAIVEIVHDGRKWVAVLSTGLRAPVSQSYREIVRKEGLAL